MTNAEVFRSAAAIIQKRGWCKDGYYNANGNVCLVGAVTQALGQGIETPEMLVSPWQVEDSAVMRRLIKVLRADGMWEVARWNDEPERVVTEVIDLLESAAFDEDLKAAATPADTTIPVAVQIPQLVEA